jgi:pilus assembly protein CpaF
MATNKWKLTKGIFGPLWPYIEDDSVTDIDWDGDSLWIEYAKGTKQSVEVEGIDAGFVDNFTQFVANHVARPFNQVDNTLSAETETLRITVAHESLVTSGRCFSIRKSMPKLRFCAAQALEEAYCPEKLMHFLVNCVEIRQNFAFCGEPGHGKTECAKFFSTFIRPADKVITVEDTLEWHYKHINPGKRADEIKVNSDEDYVKAIKLALRLNPTWLMLSEARSTEVRYLIEGWTTGVCGMTTLHTNDVRSIPDRVVNMMGQGIEPGRMVNNIYSNLNIGVLLEKDTDLSGSVSRRITQVAVFERIGERNVCTMVMENGLFDRRAVPESVQEKMRKAGISDICCSRLLKERLMQEGRGIYYGMEAKSEWENPLEYGRAVAEDIEEPW